MRKRFNNIESQPPIELPKGKAHGKAIIEKLWSARVGAGTSVFCANISGIWLGGKTFALAPFSVDMEGNVIATSIAITGGSMSGVTISDYLKLTGGTMSGYVILHAAPDADMKAANKKYVDDQVSGVPLGDYLELAGGTLTGSLMLDHAPTLDLEAATKKYVDDNYSKIVSFNDEVLLFNDEIVYNL